MVWRVGDDTHIKIWEDPWIPRGTTTRPIIHRGTQEAVLVSGLIDQDRPSWNKSLIRNMLCPEDVEEIIFIPICANSEDWVAWHFDSRGCSLLN